MVTAIFIAGLLGLIWAFAGIASCFEIVEEDPAFRMPRTRRALFAAGPTIWVVALLLALVDESEEARRHDA